MDKKELKNIEYAVQGMVVANTKAMQETEKRSKDFSYDLKNQYDKEIFIPTEKQMKFLRSVFNTNSGNQMEDWVQHCGVSMETLGTWREQPGFMEWLLSETEKRAAFFRLEWLKIGIEKMRLNVPTWVEMGKLFFKEGLQHSPAEKGSRREKLEQEMKRLVSGKK